MGLMYESERASKSQIGASSGLDKTHTFPNTHCKCLNLMSSGFSDRGGDNILFAVRIEKRFRSEYNQDRAAVPFTSRLPPRNSSRPPDPSISTWERPWDSSSRRP